MGRKLASRKQNVLILTEANTGVEYAQLETDVLYAASPETIEAWELDTNQQARDELTGRYIQVVSERSKKPLRIFKDRPLLSGPSTEAIASQKQDAELAFLNTKSQKNSMLIWIGIICVILAVIIGLIVLLNLNQTSAFAMAFPLTSLLTRRNGKRKSEITTIADLEPLQETRTGIILCILFIEKTHTWQYRQLDKSLIPEDSTERKLKGKKPVHILNLDKEGKLWAIEPENTVKPNDSPQDLFLALQYEREVDEVYGLSESLGEKIKLGIFFVLCFFLLIILFLIATVAMGG